jgi:hypothetical protein
MLDFRSYLGGKQSRAILDSFSKPRGNPAPRKRMQMGAACNLMELGSPGRGTARLRGILVREKNR